MSLEAEVGRQALAAAGGRDVAALKAGGRREPALNTLGMWRRAEILIALLVLQVSAVGCDDSSKGAARDAGVGDAQPNEALMDKNIVNAVQSARQQTSGSAEVVDGPPPSGVFEPGMADKAHPRGAPIKMTLYDKGSEPRVVVAPNLDLHKPAILKITVTNRMGKQVRPNVDYTLSVSVTSPKDADGKDGAVAELPVDAGATTPKEREISFTIKAVVPSTQQPGQLPPSLGKAIGKLKGSRIFATLAPDGSLSGERIELAKKADAALGDLVAPLVEVLGLYFSPWPTEPVGQGAYWIATDRTTIAGMDVIRYRITKLEKLEGTQIAFSLDLRLWAAGSNSVPQGTPEGFLTLGFNAVGKAAWVRNAGDLLPIMGQLKAPIVVQLGDPKQPERVLPVQLETGADIQPIVAPQKAGD